MKRTIFYSSTLLLAVALGSVAAFPVGSQTSNIAPGTNGLSLDAAIQLALEANPQLRASLARVDASVGRAKQARQWGNPELELSAEDWPVSGGQGFADAKQTIGVAQTLPFPGKKALDGQIGNAGVKLSEAELTLRRTELVRDVKSGFFRVLASERVVEVAKQLVVVAESSANTARKRVDAGAAAYQEQLRAEVQLEQARTELTGFERELATAQQAFATLLGRPDLNHAKLTGALADRPNARLLELTPEEHPGTHPLLNTAQANLDRAQLEYRRVRLEPYPDVKVGVAGGRIGATDESIIQLGFSLPLPLIDRGKGKRQEARANVNVAEAEMLAAQQQLQREWANARKRYRTAAEQVANYRERILPKAAEALRLIQTGFEEGKFNFIDLVDTQRTTAEARLAYQEKLLELNVAQAELEAMQKPQTHQTLTTK
ncbi:MAG: TolC family protein [Verrucomicrobia bacterium]|nr:TolC family protein [Verrucomicrobiota bacterium]